jgi:hypothetical protein
VDTEDTAVVMTFNNTLVLAWLPIMLKVPGHFNMGGAAFDCIHCGQIFLVAGDYPSPFDLNIALIQAPSHLPFCCSTLGCGSNMCLPSHSSVLSPHPALPPAGPALPYDPGANASASAGSDSLSPASKLDTSNTLGQGRCSAFGQQSSPPPLVCAC